jgi:hypothetical protein
MCNQHLRSWQRLSSSRHVPPAHIHRPCWCSVVGQHNNCLKLSHLLECDFETSSASDSVQARTYVGLPCTTTAADLVSGTPRGETRHYYTASLREPMVFELTQLSGLVSLSNSDRQLCSARRETRLVWRSTNCDNVMQLPRPLPFFPDDPCMLVVFVLEMACSFSVHGPNLPRLRRDPIR